MPQNARIVVHKTMRNNVNIIVGKKRAYTEKHGHVLPDKFIVFLGRTFSGHNHDYSMLKQELPPEFDWFSDIHVLVDLGYLGIQSDYRGDQIAILTGSLARVKRIRACIERRTKGYE